MPSISAIATPIIFATVFLGLTVSCVLLSSTVYVFLSPFAVSGGEQVPVQISGLQIFIGLILIWGAVLLIWLKKRQTKCPSGKCKLKW